MRQVFDIEPVQHFVDPVFYLGWTQTKIPGTEGNIVIHGRSKKLAFRVMEYNANALPDIFHVLVTYLFSEYPDFSACGLDKTVKMKKKVCSSRFR